MDDDNKGTYSAVPPPSSLTGSSAPVNFNDALSKARAIAEKLKQQSAGHASPAPPASAPSVGSKRGYTDDAYGDDQDYRSGQSYSSRNHYYDERDSKRGLYENDSSRGEYGSSESRRYGLGSEERRAKSSAYGPLSGAIHQEEHSVPSHMVGLIIGKGGESLRRIENTSGARVQFAPDDGEAERRVNLTGEPDQIKIARDMIQQVVEDTRASESAKYGGRPGLDAAPAPLMSGIRSSLNIVVPSSKVGLLIGRGGETIRDLEARSNAKITVAPEIPGERSFERSVSLVGDEAAIQRAKSLIDEIVNEEVHSSAVTSSRDWSAYRQQHYQGDEGRHGHGHSRNEKDEYGDRSGGSAHLTGANAYASGANAYPSGGGGGHDSYGHSSHERSYGSGGGYGGHGGRFNEDRESVQVPKSAVGFIIGRGGETVRMLQDQSGARIKVDQNANPDSMERTINIFGTPEAVAHAKQLILDKVEEGNVNRGGRDGGRRGGGYGSGGYGRGSGSYGNQGYSSSYGDSADTSGYDYSQYQQYYQQYGYSQYPPAAGQEENADQAQGYYGAYPYGYEGYGQYPQAASGTTDNAAAGSTANEGGDSKENGNTSTTGETSTDAPKAPAAEGAAAPKDDAAAAYYAQYYGADQSQWNQEAYYQWYQQYYGGQYAGAQGDQQQQNQSSEQEQSKSDDAKDNSAGEQSPSAEDSKETAHA